MKLFLQAGSSDEDGATLVEVLVVLAIVAVAVGIAWPVYSQYRDARLIPAAVGELTAIVKSKRADAIRTGRVAIVTFDLAQRRVFSDGRAVYAIPEGVSVTVTARRTEIRSQLVTALRFLPDGRSSGMDIKLEHRGRISRIVVDELSGGIRAGGM